MFLKRSLSHKNSTKHVKKTLHVNRSVYLKICHFLKLLLPTRSGLNDVTELVLPIVRPGLMFSTLGHLC